MKQRVTFRIEYTVDLDGVPGFGHEPESWKQFIESQLTRPVPHYNPVVTVHEEEQ